ncbi:casein kinase II subunit alpha [Pancytospora epiphaga]|nr:casein kinase II subunit alpha [Pancytospora epiphaga]
MKIILPKADAHCDGNVEAVCQDYNSYNITAGDIEKYCVTQYMGRGKYSEVFEGRCIKDSSKVVIKVLKPVKRAKINREVLILKSMEHKNVIPLRDVVYDRSTGLHSLIFDYIKHEDTCTIFEGMGLNEIRLYTRQVLEALEYAHSRGIVHRDVKPQNMIVNTTMKRLLLIDWGLAEFYHFKQEYSVRVASRYYKGPELLVDYPYYDYSLDIWSFGCILAELIFHRMPFFCGSKNTEQIVELIKVMGLKDLEEYLKKFEIEFEVPKMEQTERVPLISYVSEDRRILYKDAVDLLEMVLIYDHSKRPTATECLSHPFYKNKG